MTSGSWCAVVSCPVGAVTSSTPLRPQFLITTGENLDYLDGVHTVFGEVTEGLDVLAKVNQSFVDKDFVPLQDIRCVLVLAGVRCAPSRFSERRCPGSRINHAVILEDPFDDPPGLPVPERSPEPTREQLDVSVSCPPTPPTLSALEPAPFGCSPEGPLLLLRAGASARTRPSMTRRAKRQRSWRRS